MSQPAGERPIRPTRAMRGQYTQAMAAGVVTPIVLAVLYTLFSRDGGQVLAAWIGCVVLVVVLAVVLHLDRRRAKYVLHGDALVAGGGRPRRVELTRAVEAAIEVKDPKWMFPRNPYSTLVVADCVGGRTRMVFSTKRIPHLYEPEDLRLIAGLLARSTAPSAQDAARRLDSIADQGHPVIDRGV